ncbi:Cell cycle protein OS=Tsukamurella paurometabola (strain ATCC 8368 / DSM / CCUG 35730 / CIP 100753 / JCM 10117 / KCTC 9821 / NBRC 16120 / NCIMB 702349 /NCTC 13040) OX=521096 GN=Tpau_0030 PE=4 SV=1 [Tsukamurella paurometabola]|uniref:Cell cycle protein n=1 Tax=Tsukamurella paurometabola (strain ATCC 8368 / DSM 20162 / CCUG 35730 / CIP 100753 / JCM 10117 / KCTC 9821 / NBRC 16120 / NCIMB 702349 / NCTC 13040) TaxID=521096 RepID=D5UPD2_TSUPD|nr:FtsW/RodA/SpoVE family cell cycle protein [Tsukamurella paurometabola]ADG76684.1 cell cycle protein [Tsukamurella paurometabola DSM 20162]SUP41209.1 Cell division protein FtsW [Tsukamurella paurometabola]
MTSATATNTPGSGLALDPNRGSRSRELVLLGAATVITGASLAIVEWAQKQTISWDLAKYVVAFVVLYAAAHVAVRRFAPYADPLILPVVALLNGLGLVLIHRLDLGRAHGENGRIQEINEANQQILWTLMGVAVLVAILALLRDHRTLAKYAYTIGLVGLILLALPALLPASLSEINGSKNWIKTPLFSIQPSEISKILLIIFTAAFLVSKRDLFTTAGRRVLGIDLPRPRDLAPLLLVWIVALAVLGYANDLGTPLLIFFTVLAMVYIATERVGWVVVGLALAVVGAVAAYFLFSHLRVRVEVWLHPFDHYEDIGFQPAQSLFSLATGGLAGTGLGSGRPTMVPFASTDFIISAIGEELGLIGLAAVLMLFLILIFRAFRISLTVRDSFGKLLAAGLASTVAIQLFVVVGGVTKLIPLTGLTTPFVSYGGSSLLTNYALIALLLRISNAAREPKVTRKPGAPVPDRPTEIVKRV